MLYKNRDKEHKWDGIPKSPGIYYIFSRELEIIYVGYSSNLRRRMMNHAVPIQPFSSEVSSGLFTFLELQTKENAQKMEGRILQRMRGASNKKKLFPVKWPKIRRNEESVNSSRLTLGRARKIQANIKRIKRLVKILDNLLEE